AFCRAGRSARRLLEFAPEPAIRSRKEPAPHLGRRGFQMDDIAAAAVGPAQADHRFTAVARDAVCRLILFRRAARRKRLPDPNPGAPIRPPIRPPSAAYPAFPAAAHCTSVPAVSPGSAENTPTRHL